MSRFEREIEIIAESGLFDREWYLAEYPDVKAVGLDPIEHYLTVGALLLRQPSPKFDTKSYVASNSDVAATQANPLVHYITFGRAEGRRALPSGDPKTVNPSTVPTKPTSPSEEMTAPEKSPLDQDIALIQTSPLFDADWYRTEYQDVANKGVDPAAHYIRYGARELREPGPYFSTRFYLHEYPDVRQSGVNPLVHYIRIGKAEGRSPLPSLKREPWWRSLNRTSDQHSSLMRHLEAASKSPIPQKSRQF